MRAGLDPFSFLVISIAGWMNQRQQQVIEYLIEENRVLREKIGNRRMGFTDNQSCRLAANAKKLGRKILVKVATIVTPETLLVNEPMPHCGHWFAMRRSRMRISSLRDVSCWRL
jgi:hypothetical protein